MSAFDPEDFVAGCIDPDVVFRNLDRFLDGDGVMRTFEAAAIATLECGHQRPTNRSFGVGDAEFCHVCGIDAGQIPVVALDVLEEPQVFPHPDALSDLETIA